MSAAVGHLLSAQALRLASAAANRRFANSSAELVEPVGLVRAMNHAADESQPLGDVVPVCQNILPRRLRVLPDEFLKPTWLRKYIGCMACLGDLDDNTPFEIKDVLVPEEVIVRALFDNSS
jgi:hypothetical protein